jgi:CheY-like chemotaxis protein
VFLYSGCANCHRLARKEPTLALLFYASSMPASNFEVGTDSDILNRFAPYIVKVRQDSAARNVHHRSPAPWLSRRWDWITLRQPCGQGFEQCSLAQDEKVPMSKHQLRRVFVVDDERVIAETLAKILQMTGFLAEAFTNPLDALRHAQDSAPDLLISDVILPQLSGVELAMRFRVDHPACQILLLSCQAATAELLQSARNLGYSFHLLSKPVHPSDLLRAIAEGEVGSALPGSH